MELLLQKVGEDILPGVSTISIGLSMSKSEP